ncbi:MAG: protein kinase [Bacillota bacterium]|nr:protein kinase [Bacillota bacterium]
MMNHSWKSQFKLNPGTIVKGIWHKNQYTILKELGFGANGIVYLAKSEKTQVALKMSDNGMSITSEVNVLKSFAKVQGSALGPSLLDVDDWQSSQGKISFYVMEYIEGPDLLTFIQQNGKVWTPVLFLQLLNDLQKLHENGWVFGDLKPENLIVTGPPPRIRCIDVGGTTISGRAIKEFTEFYDRGYWGLGSRKAEPSYDLFAVGMMMIHTAYPKRFNKTSGGIAQIMEEVRKKAELLPYEGVILKSLKGQYIRANEMREDLLSLVIKRETDNSSKKTVDRKDSGNQSHSNQGLTRQNYKKKRKKGRFKETILLFIFIAIFYGIYIFFFTS